MLLPIASVLAAPFIGSFLGVVVTRLPQSQPVIIGRSRCEKCRHALGVSDLVPIASWFYLRGKCRYCGARISSLHPGMEIAALAVALWASSVTQGVALIASCALGWMLLTLALIDWRRFLLPDELTLLLALSGLAAAYVLDTANFTDHLIGAAAGLLAFLGLGWIYRQIRHRDGLGFGDAKLLGALGAWLSWEGLPSVIFLAAITALAWTLARHLAGQRLTARDRLPFGPFLAAGGWLVWLYGPLSSS